MATVDEQIERILDEVWSLFNRASILHNRAIIEYIARFLLEIEGMSSSELELELKDFVPRRPSHLSDSLQEEINGKLDNARILAKGVGTFFDRYVLFHSFDFTQKESYPIPRHIERFMLNILDIRPQDTFADFTCGSGGFLVNRYVTNGTHTGTSVGIDISPEWIRIACANI